MSTGRSFERSIVLTNLLFLSLVAGWTLSARAAPVFAPVQCPACVTGQWTGVPFNFSVGMPNNWLGKGLQGLPAAGTSYDWEVPQSPYAAGDYINGVDRQISVSGNRFIQDIQIDLAQNQGTVAQPANHHFYLDPASSFLQWGRGTSNCTPDNAINKGVSFTPQVFLQGVGWVDNPTPWQMTGDQKENLNKVAGTYMDTCTPNPVNGTSLNLQPLFMTFHAGRTGTAYGFTIPDVKVCCSAGMGHGGFTPLIPGQVDKGLMLGVNDTVYFSMKAPTDPTVHTTFNIWSNAQDTNDDQYGIYVSCNVPVTAGNFAWSRSDALPGPSQYLHIPANTCTNGTFYVAVNELAQGPHNHAVGVLSSFNILGSMHAAGWHLRSLWVGTDFVPTAAELTQIQTMLTNGAQAWFGATLGGAVVEQFDLWAHGAVGTSHDCPGATSPPDNHCKCNGGDCDVCVSNICTRSCTPTMNQVVACTDIWQQDQRGPYGFVHEASHAFMGYNNNTHYPFLGEEYEELTSPTGSTTFPSQCGHTVMATPWRDDLNTYCWNFDHGLDNNAPDSVNTQCGPNKQPACASGWDIIRTSMSPAMPVTSANFWAGTPSDSNMVNVNFHAAARQGDDRLGAIVAH